MKLRNDETSAAPTTGTRGREGESMLSRTSKKELLELYSPFKIPLQETFPMSVLNYSFFDITHLPFALLSED